MFSNSWNSAGQWNAFPASQLYGLRPKRRLYSSSPNNASGGWNARGDAKKQKMDSFASSCLGGHASSRISAAWIFLPLWF
jgi:hypothetical protein